MEIAEVLTPQRRLACLTLDFETDYGARLHPQMVPQMVPATFTGAGAAWQRAVLPQPYFALVLARSQRSEQKVEA